MQGKKREARVRTFPEGNREETHSQLNGETETETLAQKNVDSEAGAGRAEDSQVKRLEEELERERERSADYLRRLQYLQADFENYRKRVEREMTDVKRYGNDRLLAEFLVVVDEFELGLNRARQEQENPALVEGMQMVLKRFQNLLVKEGVARIESTGSKFDPSIHEAALRVPSEIDEGIIVEEIRPGYTLKGRVLRPSIVKVSEGRRKAENVPNNTEKIVEEEEQ